MIEFVTATAAHAQSMALRSEDLAELRAAHPDADPQALVAESLALSVGGAVAALDDEGRVVCVFGVSVVGPHAHPWMLCSDLITQHRKTTMRVAPAMIAHWRAVATGRPLCNWIHKHNESAKAFVQWLGFTIFPTPHGDFDFFLLCANP